MREFPLKPGHGEADYLLFVDGTPFGVVEAKKEGDTLTRVELQTTKYSEGVPDNLTTPRRPLPFQYQSTGVETRFTNLLEADARSRSIFSFHRPDTLPATGVCLSGSSAGCVLAALSGWALRRTLEAALALEALRRALRHRRPKPGQVHHSDRFHMTDMRSRQWREDHGLTETDADRRIDQACVILDQLANLHPIHFVMNAGDFRDAFREIRVTPAERKQFAASEFEPDYSCFLGYAWVALKYLAGYHPGADKLDFVVERKNTVTKHIQDFHSQLPDALTALGNPELARLVGELIPGGKDRLPLHAADLLCWYCARRERLETMAL